MIAAFCTCLVVALFCVLFAHYIDNAIKELQKKGKTLIFAAVSAANAVDGFRIIGVMAALGACITGTIAFY
jgi:hypothetical protein